MFVKVAVLFDMCAQYCITISLTVITDVRNEQLREIHKNSFIINTIIVIMIIIMNWLLLYYYHCFNLIIFIIVVVAFMIIIVIVVITLLRLKLCF